MIEIKPGECVTYQGSLPPVIQKGEMSMRDYFAASVLQGICGRPLIELATEANSINKDIKTYVSDVSYSIADAMLKSRMRSDDEA